MFFEVIILDGPLGKTECYIIHAEFQVRGSPHFQLVKTFQLHRHSKTCLKYRYEKCRFSLGRSFTDHTITTEQIWETIPAVENDIIMQKNFCDYEEMTMSNTS